MVDEDGMSTDDSTFFAPSVAKGSVSRVVTANGATMWHGLRLMNVPAARPDRGALFRLPAAITV